MQNFLDKIGLSYFWQRIKTYIDNLISDTKQELVSTEQMNSAINNAIGDINTILDAINGEDV